MSNNKFDHIEKIRREKFWLNNKGQLRDKNPLIGDLMNSIECLSEGLYSKDTHFIFELIQNAEDNTYNDVEPSISFRLVKNDPTNTQNSVGALIIQNNEIGFSPDNIDAICSVGKTTKSKIKGYIGEKGIGFKSVFRITTIPHIFSGGYQFCLPEKFEETGLGYIVPQWVESLPEAINLDLTTIILPLDKVDFGYETIEVMLRDIEPETILFLTKLKEIQIKTELEDDFTILKDDKKYPLIQVMIEGVKQGIDNSTINEFLLYNKLEDRPQEVNHEKRVGIDNRDVSIAFPLDVNKESKGKIFAYLPVRLDTGLPFLINADFVLTSSREEIVINGWNKWLMKCVANLLEDKLPLLRDEELLTIELLETFTKIMLELNVESIFYPIVEMLHNAFQSQELLPAEDGTFVSAREAKLIRGAKLRKLLTHGQLRELFQTDDDIKCLSGEITENKTRNLYSYLKTELKVDEIRPKKEGGSAGFAEMISSSFITKQSDEWMIAFYQFLNSNGQEPLWKKGDGSYYNQDGPLRNKPFIRLDDGITHVSPFKKDNSPNAYLPPENKTDYPIVSREIIKNENVLVFLKKIGLSLPNAVSEVIDKIIPKYTQNHPIISEDEHMKDIKKIFHAYSTEDSQEKKLLLANKLKGTAFIHAENPVLQTNNYKKPEQLYFIDEELIIFFNGNKDTWFVSSKYDADLCDLFKELGVFNGVRVSKKEPDYSKLVIISKPYKGSEYDKHIRGINSFDPNIKVDGLEYALTHLTIDKSLFIWNHIAVENTNYIRGIVESSTRQTYEDSDKEEQVSKNFGHLLIEIPWLPDKQGNFHYPGELGLEDLPATFQPHEKLADQLGMKKDVVAKLAEEVGVSQDAIMFAKNHPRLLEELIKKNQLIEPDNACIETETSQNKIDYKDEFGKCFNRPGETELQEQAADSGKVRNPDRRREKSYDGHKERLHSEPQPNERRKETIRTIIEGPDEQVREYLLQLYGGKCQICSKTFPERDGKPYFIANYIVPKKLARFVDVPANALCLCADHFAKWQHGAVETENISGQIDAFRTETEDKNSLPILRIKLCGAECEIVFKEKHLLDLQELVKASQNGK